MSSELLEETSSGFHVEKGISSGQNNYVLPEGVAPLQDSTVFGVSLEELMSKQAQTFPQLRVPRVLLFLKDLIYRLDGTSAEGLFRVPGFPEELKTIKENLNQGIEEFHSQWTVHSAAAIFKLWFRELPEPIIPDQY